MSSRWARKVLATFFIGSIRERIAKRTADPAGSVDAPGAEPRRWRYQQI
jgi:hypothetical protein